MIVSPVNRLRCLCGLAASRESLQSAICYLSRPKLDQVGARKLDVSNASKETCNLCQPTFVVLYFVSEPPV